MLERVRFAVEMGVRRPQVYGRVIALSVAGDAKAKFTPRPADPPHYHLAARLWKKGFHPITTDVAALRAADIPVSFTTRVAGHGNAMWEECVTAFVRAWETKPK